MNVEVAAPPLVQRLVQACGARWIEPDNLEAFVGAPGARVLFLCGDPVRFPEGLDVAVVLPELHAALDRCFAVGVVPPHCEDQVARRFGVQRWPALVFFRDGAYLTTLAGMYDWSDFVQRTQQALALPPSRRPGIGIAVVTQGGASPCH